MSKWKKFFKGLGVASVPALCTYAIIGAVVVPLLIFETGASKEYNNTAQERSEKFWMNNFSKESFLNNDSNPSNDVVDKLENHFSFIKHEDQFTVDGRKSAIYELATASKDSNGNDLTPTVVNPNSDKLMIFSHGLNSTHWNVMESAYYWAKLGYRVISWDQRGGGDNRDSHITFGYAESDDLSDLYKNVLTSNEFKGIDEITMYGQSNGAATTIAFADRYQDIIRAAKNTSGTSVKTRFIEESGYTSPERQFNTALDLHGIMPAAVVPLTIPMYELYADKHLSDKDADYLAQSDQIKQPLFIVHGDEDPIVNYKMGVELYETMMKDADRKPESSATDADKAQPSVLIGQGLKHIGISRDSKINVDADLEDKVADLFETDIKTSKDASDAKAKYTALKDEFKAEGKVLPVAVRFFVEIYMWDHFKTQLEDLGGEEIYV